MNIWFHSVPLNLEFRNPGTNLRHIEQEIEQRLKLKPGLPSTRQCFVFPELTLHGFVTLKPEAIACSQQHSYVQSLGEIARRHQVAIVAGWIESSEASKPKNALGFFDETGTLQSVYYKIHLFNRGRPSEAETFIAGSEPKIVAWNGIKIGFSICYDLRFPKLYQNYAINGCDVILCSACWVGGPNKSLQFRALSQAHAILTRSYFISVNRSGSDPYFDYEGEAIAFDPRGVEIHGLVEIRKPILDEVRSVPMVHES